VSRLRAPLGPVVRLDTHLEDGASVPPWYDSLIAKLVVWDGDRPAAIARALRALRELELEGIPTTRELAIAILEDDGFASGEYSTGYLAAMQSVREPATAAS
jgi:acetyl-CoA carboxylase biotin carboxylase subunit